MRNKYLKDLSKIEFAVTYACTGRCKHCSEGDHTACGDMMDPQIAASSVRKIAAEYDIKTVMTFGGEPLLHTRAVYAVMSAASELGIQKRQVITNGYFSDGTERIKAVTQRLAECGVNDLLVSVDAFHQETIPLDTVELFVLEAKRRGIPTRFQPAWLVSPTDDNPYNKRTGEILDSLRGTGIEVGEGNVIFPSGNALKYLSEYFVGAVPKDPYIEDPCDIRCISFSPNGDVLDGNVYREDIMDIIDGYDPHSVR